MCDGGRIELETERRLKVPVEIAKEIKTGDEYWIRKVLGEEVIAEVSVIITEITINNDSAYIKYKELD